MGTMEVTKIHVHVIKPQAGGHYVKHHVDKYVVFLVADVESSEVWQKVQWASWDQGCAGRKSNDATVSVVGLYTYSISASFLELKR